MSNQILSPLTPITIAPGVPEPRPTPMAGDVTGSTLASTVVKVEGNLFEPVTYGALQDGYQLTWVNGATQWQAKPGSGGSGFTAGGDLTGTSSSQNIIQIAGNITLEKYGAIGNGIADDHAAYTSALASGQTIFLGAKTYLTEAYTGGLAANTSLFGTGSQSVLKNLSNQPIVTISGDWVNIRGVNLFGTFGAGATNHGISGGVYSHVMINDVWIYEPGHHGIVFTGNSAANQGPSISNVRIFDAVNGAGIALDGSQYATVSNAHAIGGTYGIYIDAGNAVVTGSTFDLNTYGLYINNINGNDGHGVVVGCNFNHNTLEAIHIEPLINGFDIRSSNIYYADIRVIGGTGIGKPSLVRFKDSAIDVGALQLDGALVEFDSCVWPSANANTFNTAVNAHASTIIWRPNNMKLDGTPFDSTIDPQWDVAATRSLNVKWAGTTVKSHWTGAHGMFYAGQGTTEAATVIGPMPGFETSITGVWGLGTSFDCGVAPTATNPMLYTEGGSTFINAPHHLGFGSISFYAGGSGFLGKFDALNAVFSVGSKFKFDWSAATLQTIDATSTSFKLSQADVVTNSATGAVTTIQAQNATGTTSIGGNLVLQAGTGTLVTEFSRTQGGDVIIYGYRHAIGLDGTTIASGVNSFALGYDSQATSTYAISIGAHCRSGGGGSFAAGESCIASNNNSVAIGWSNTSAAYGSACVGMYLQATADAEGAFACGVSAVARLPGEFNHTSGLTSKVGFINQGHREIDIYTRANATTANANMRSGAELTLQPYCLSTIRVRVSAGTTSFGKVAAEEALVLVKTTSGSISTIIGSVTWTTIGQTFASQSWSVTISIPSANTFRVACNSGSDDVEFFARVDIMDQAL